MWDWSGKATRDARQFAFDHSLAFDGDDAPGLPSSQDAHPFEGERRRLCISGEWRGRAVQRFLVGGATVELMTLPRPLPRLQVIPSGLDLGALALGGRVVATGDPAFDRQMSVISDDHEFAAAFLTPAMREALLHPAAAGRALTVDGEAMYTVAVGLEDVSHARIRLDFLCVVAGRIDDAVWALRDKARQASDEVWLPAAASDEGPQWDIAPLPQRTDDDSLSDTNEFEVSVFGEEIEQCTFVPEPIAPQADRPMWAVAQYPQY